MADILNDVLSRRTVHLCVDMQGMFAEETDWQTPWMKRVLPVVDELAGHRPQDTIFTRFMPPERAEERTGTWRAYFERWHQFTTAEIDPGLLDLVPPLRRHVPPGRVIDKPAYSPFVDTDLDALLRGEGVETLIVTGAETDVCVLAAVMSAVDLGYAIVLPKDALCSSSDQTHDALIETYSTRYGGQVVLSDLDAILKAWR